MTVSKRITLFCAIFIFMIFSLLSLWKTRTDFSQLIQPTTQEVHQYSQQISLPPSDFKHSPSPSSTPSSVAVNSLIEEALRALYPSPEPYAIFIPASIHGTRERKTQNYFDTTVNTPLNIPVKDLFGEQFFSVSTFSLEDPEHGTLDMGDDLQTVVYTPDRWYEGLDLIKCQVDIYDEYNVRSERREFGIRIRRGITLNSEILTPPEGYLFSETSQGMSNQIALTLRSSVISLVPIHDTWLNRRYNTCAVVGNGGSLRGSKRGQEIDSHDVVVRINLSPIKTYERDVGSKMNLSISNGPTFEWCWIRANETNRKYEILPQWTFLYQLQRLEHCADQNPHIKYAPLSYLFVDLVDDILNEYNRVLFNSAEKKYRSTGMMAVTAMAMICDHVSVYGFERGPNMENNYYDGGHDREWSGHSYQAEKAYFRDLANGTGLFEPFLELYDLYKSFSYIVN